MTKMKTKLHSTPGRHYKAHIRMKVKQAVPDSKTKKVMETNSKTPTGKHGEKETQYN